jgi:glycosyltransferase involved in cell wall biosynthesis
MNIAIDIKVLAKDKAGIARALRSTLEHLQRIDTTNNYFLFQRRPSDFKPSAANFRTVLVPSRLPGLIWIIVRLPAMLRRFGIDLLWEPENILPGFFPRRVRRVVTVHDITFVHFPQTMRRWNRWTSMLFFKHSLSRADRVVTDTEFGHRDLAQSFGRKITERKTVVVPLGAADWRPPPGYDAARRGNHLLFVGSLEPRKNLINLLRAMILLRDRGLRIDLRCAGPSGWKQGGEQDFIAANKLDAQVTRCGFLTDEALLTEYCACKALAFASLFEGFGLPVLEALATDTLVLASANTVLEEIGSPAVMLCDPHDPADIAAKLEAMYAPGFDRNRYLSQRGQVLARYTWENTARMMLRIFEESLR